MLKHHLVISGTGRAGTTLLVQLLTQLGLDTGYPDPWAKINADSNAGMEWDLRKEGAPYIVKSPALCENLVEILQSGRVVVDHAIVPVRDLFSAAESRREVARKGNPKFLTPKRWLFWRIRNPARQEAVLTEHLYRLIHTITRHNIPLTLLDFPRFVTDVAYLFTKLRPIFPRIEETEFRRAFQTVSRPEMVHDFNRTARLNGAGGSSASFQCDMPV